MLTGRKDRNSYGLIDKIRAGGLTVEARSETESIGDGSRKKQTRYNLFAFDPAKFNLLESYSNVVTLKTDSKRPDPDGPRPDPGIGSDPLDPLDIDIDYNRDREDPKDPKGTEKPPVEGSSQKSSLSLKGGSSGSFGSDGEADAVFGGSARGSSGGSECPAMSKIARETPARSGQPERPKDTQPARDSPASERFKAAARMEFGIAGWVDPAKLAHALKLPLGEVEAWLQANYVAYDRPGGGVGYRQRRAGEEAPA